jgi:hypothetical protein
VPQYGAAAGEGPMSSANSSITCASGWSKDRKTCSNDEKVALHRSEKPHVKAVAFMIDESVAILMKKFATSTMPPETCE